MAKNAPKVTVKVTTKDAGLKQLAKNLKTMGSFVQVGVFGAKGSQKKGVSTLAQIAVLHEFGSPKQGIPSRPFMRLTFEQNRAKYAKYLVSQLDSVVTGALPIKTLLDRLGLMVSSDMQLTISQGRELKPLAQSTILGRTKKSGQKVRSSKRKTTPLLDTGQLIKAISFKTFIVRSQVAIGVSFGGTP